MPRHKLKTWSAPASHRDIIGECSTSLNQYKDVKTRPFVVIKFTMIKTLSEDEGGFALNGNNYNLGNWRGELKTIECPPNSGHHILYAAFTKNTKLSYNWMLLKKDRKTVKKIELNRNINTGEHDTTIQDVYMVYTPLLTHVYKPDYGTHEHQLVPVLFKTQHTIQNKSSQAVAVLGNKSHLGKWKPINARVMFEAEPNTWVTILYLPITTTFQYKFVVVEKSKGKRIVYGEKNNHTFSLKRNVNLEVENLDENDAEEKTPIYGVWTEAMSSTISIKHVEEQPIGSVASDIQLDAQDSVATRDAEEMTEQNDSMTEKDTLPGEQQMVLQELLDELECSLNEDSTLKEQRSASTDIQQSCDSCNPPTEYLTATQQCLNWLGSQQSSEKSSLLDETCEQLIQLKDIILGDTNGQPGSFNNNDELNILATSLSSDQNMDGETQQESAGSTNEPRKSLLEFSDQVEEVTGKSECVLNNDMNITREAKLSVDQKSTASTMMHENISHIIGVANEPREPLELNINEESERPNSAVNHGLEDNELLPCYDQRLDDLPLPETDGIKEYPFESKVSLEIVIEQPECISITEEHMSGEEESSAEKTPHISTVLHEKCEQLELKVDEQTKTEMHNSAINDELNKMMEQPHCNQNLIYRSSADSSGSPEVIRKLQFETKDASDYVSEQRASITTLKEQKTGEEKSVMDQHATGPATIYGNSSQETSLSNENTENMEVEVLEIVKEQPGSMTNDDGFKSAEAISGCLAEENEFEQERSAGIQSKPDKEESQRCSYIFTNLEAEGNDPQPNTPQNSTAPDTKSQQHTQAITSSAEESAPDTKSQQDTQAIKTFTEDTAPDTESQQNPQAITSSAEESVPDTKSQQNPQAIASSAEELAQDTKSQQNPQAITSSAEEPAPDTKNQQDTQAIKTFTEDTAPDTESQQNPQAITSSAEESAPMIKARSFLELYRQSTSHTALQGEQQVITFGNTSCTSLHTSTSHLPCYKIDPNQTAPDVASKIAENLPWIMELPQALTFQVLHTIGILSEEKQRIIADELMKLKNGKQQGPQKKKKGIINFFKRKFK